MTTQMPGEKSVTITLTEIEPFAIISAVQLAESVMPELSDLGNYAKDTAKKMHDCMDTNSLLYQHLNKGWNSETSNNQSFINFLETSPLEGSTS